MDTEDLLIKLRELKPIMNARYKAKEIGLFGSYVRGQQKEESDIDLLIDFDEGADLFDMIGLGTFLEDTLKRSVDIVPKRGLRNELRESILHEVVAI